MEVAILFAVVVGLMLIGVPIAVSLGMASILFLLALGDTSLASIAQTFFQAMAGHYTLLAIPFFILASSFMSTGGVARRIIRFSVALVGHVPGGLAIAGVFACMMFAALVGLFAGDGCGDWLHRDRGHASGWVYERLSRLV